MKKLFLVVYEKGRKNYSGFAPDVPGCGSLGVTLEEIRTNLHEALQLYIDTSAELGYALPEPTTNTITLPIEGETDPKTTYVVERMSVTFPRAKLVNKAKPRRMKVSTSKRRMLQAA
ncbi:MAG: type II toxin-antitoxin system HicB family antitoxin [Acidobacteriaceae bacterium]